MLKNSLQYYPAVKKQKPVLSIPVKQSELFHLSIQIQKQLKQNAAEREKGEKIISLL